MKFKNILRVGGVLAIAVIAALPLAARADAQHQSFGATNQLASGVALTTYPTNSTGTNLTGGALNIGNYDRGLGFYFAGYVTTAGTATVTLVRSPYSFSPSITSLSNNFETVSQKTLTIPMPTTGPFNWTTNLDAEYVKAGIWLGMNSMTNAAGVVTNLDVGLVKKLVPVGSR